MLFVDVFRPVYKTKKLLKAPMLKMDVLKKPPCFIRLLCWVTYSCQGFLLATALASDL